MIWAESGNSCAICGGPLLADATETDDMSIMGDEAHIVPRSEGGRRAEGRLGMTQAELDSDSNLLVLCKRDHKLVDDQPNHYTIEKLRRIKAEHRKRINSLRERQRQGAGQAEKVAAWPSVVRSEPYVPDSAPAWGASGTQRQ